MKKILLVIFGCFLVAKSYSQYNYYRISAGGNFGVNAQFADLKQKNPAQTLAFNLDYHFTPFISAGIEYQNGTLSGGNVDNDPNYRYFKNKYSTFSVGGKVQLGQVIDFEGNNFLYAIRGLYSGIGFGIINNNQTEIVREKPFSDPTYVFPGDNKSRNFLIPLNFGMNINLLNRWGYTRYILNFNYQLNATFGEGLDGYDDASNGKAWSKIPDMYGVASVGVRVCFGPEGLY